MTRVLLSRGFIGGTEIYSRFSHGLGITFSSGYDPLSRHRDNGSA